MTRIEMAVLIARALPFLFGLAVVTLGLCVFLQVRSWWYEARERQEAQSPYPRVPTHSLAVSQYDEEEHWLRVLKAELQERGIHAFTSKSDSSTDEVATDTAAPNSLEQRELTSILDSTGSAPPDAKEVIERSIWKDMPRRGWPKEGGQFEFKHLPTGSTVVLTRSNGCSWTAFASLPRTPGVQNLRLPNTFKQQYSADWVGGWSFSKIDKSQTREAVEVAKKWLLAALSDEIEVTEGALTPTRNKERDYFGPRSLPL